MINLFGVSTKLNYYNNVNRVFALILLKLDSGFLTPCISATGVIILWDPITGGDTQRKFPTSQKQKRTFSILEDQTQWQIGYQPIDVDALVTTEIQV